MADLKISQLPLLQGAPGANSQIILNDATGSDFVTKRAPISALSGGSFYPPTKIVMRRSDGSSDFDLSVGGWSKRSPFIVATSAVQTVNVPAGATHMLVSYTCSNVWRNSDSQYDDGYGWGHRRQYCIHHLRIKSGGLWVDGSPEDGNPGGPKTIIKNPFWHTVPYKNNLPQATNDDYYSKMAHTKVKLVKLDAGATTVGFEGEVKLYMGGRNRMTGFIGDATIIPIKADAATAEAIAGFFGSGDEFETDDSWEVSQEEADKSYALAAGAAFRARAKNIIDIIVDYLESYDEISNGQPIPDALERELKRLKRRVNSAVFNSVKLNDDDTLTPLDTMEKVDTELLEVYNRVHELVLVPFDFETAAGATAADLGGFV